MDKYMKLNEKQANVLSMFIMVAIMTCVVTLVTALPNNYFEFVGWIKGWGISFLVAFPTVLLVMPMTKKIASTLIKK
ncbi:MAG: DUF2798 domain-containing protein [Bacteroidales bacterium]